MYQVTFMNGRADEKFDELQHAVTFGLHSRVAFFIWREEQHKIESNPITDGIRDRLIRDMIRMGLLREVAEQIMNDTLVKIERRLVMKYDPYGIV